LLYFIIFLSNHVIFKKELIKNKASNSVNNVSLGPNDEKMTLVLGTSHSVKTSNDIGYGKKSTSCVKEMESAFN